MSTSGFIEVYTANSCQVFGRFAYSDRFGREDAKRRAFACKAAQKANGEPRVGIQDVSADASGRRTIRRVQS